LWWKFDEYELRDGLICPSQKALASALETYNPWKMHRDSDESPYQELSCLVRRLGVNWVELCANYEEVDDEGPYTSEPSEEHFNDSVGSAVIQFCNRFGLFGILSQQALSIRDIPFIVDEYYGLITQNEYVRIGGVWTDRKREIEVDDLNEIPGPPDLPDPAIVHYPFFGPLFAGSIRTSKIDVSKRYMGYKFMPLTRNFWSSYREPLSDWLRFAWAFDQALEPAGHLEFDYLLSSTSEPLVSGESIDVSSNRAPSLLAIFALMAAEDKRRYGRLIRCKVCGMPVQATRATRKYCGRRCKSRDKKREQRLRKKLTTYDPL
jgi:hypothetical protein